MANKRKRVTKADENHFYFVTHGQTNAGYVKQTGDQFTAIDTSGRKIGIFESMKLAADTVDESYARARSLQQSSKKRKAQRAAR